MSLVSVDVSMILSMVVVPRTVTSIKLACTSVTTPVKLLKANWVRISCPVSSLLSSRYLPEILKRWAKGTFMFTYCWYTSATAIAVPGGTPISRETDTCTDFWVLRLPDLVLVEVRDLEYS